MATESQAKKPPKFATLTDAVREAYREMCRTGECSCITVEEHKKMLKGA